ncbi:MAG TPA: GTPase HflX, partial [Halanaerobiales bacterium]|nr:GTPase HflX [Halanaerobiales bacterium]
CNLEVVGQISQNLEQINKTHYIGTGKIEELAGLAGFTGADLVIASDELSPSQLRVLEDRLAVEVIDRTMLILDIFARRAQSREAKLQVEVARLEYMLPRLVGQKEYDRQGGGDGFKNRGAGETSLELDRRRIENKIAFLKKELKGLVSQREVQRKNRQRSGLPVVSLAGYTNAGKSTIMNSMIKIFNSSKDKQVFEEDMLFATLDTSVRRIKLPDNKSFLLTDTVGFVNKLPHHLVKSFRSTLEEIIEADLIIHVVDYSDPKYQKLIEITDKTLKEIGAENIPVIYAYNKVDLTTAEYPRSLNDNSIFLSARQGSGINELLDLIKSHIFENYLHCELFVPYEEGQIVSYFHENANVLKTAYEKQGTRLNVECKQSDFERFQNYICMVL